ncbi:hypothetical protein MBLNU230_g4893t1 [Neophaeotheca triangularis]
MADLAALLLRTTARAFYSTEHILVIDALILHSTLQDSDLAHLLGMQTKHLRKLCGKLREDGLLSVQSRAERRADGTGSYYGGAPGAGGRERLTHRDWYYLNFHRAIDSIKFRIHKLNRRIEATAAPTTVKKDLCCPRCKSEYTELEVLDNIDSLTGGFMCHKCGHELKDVDESTRANEDEGMKRLNSQLERMLGLMKRIDATSVPENDFEMALSKQKPIKRPEEHPGARMEVVDLPGGRGSLQSVKGLEVKPEKIAISLQDDETVRKEAEAEEARVRREAEARANALPEWISKSTVSGDITAVGAKEERLRREREAHAGVVVEKTEEDTKAEVKDAAGQDDEMEAYWAELRQANAEAAAKQREEDEEDEEEDDEDEADFEDVAGLETANATPALPTDVSRDEPSTGVNSSNATDDERDAKKPRLGDAPTSGGQSADSVASGEQKNGTAPVERAEDTPAASDEDEDELQFEDVS